MAQTPTSHVAPGQAAGYLFQPERALYWLSTVETHAAVGIETDDDVAVAVSNGTVTREQLKHSTSGNVPFGDRSHDLWNTLLIWIDAAKAGEFDPDSCMLLMTTNETLGDCFVKRLVACKRGPRKIKKCLAELMSPAVPFPGTISPFVQRLDQHDPALVHRVLGCIQVLDGDSEAGSKLRSKTASQLHLPSDVSHADILDGLLGWIHFTTIQAWRNRKPAWIKRVAFDNQLHRLIRKARAYHRLGVPEHLINVPKSERQSQLNQMYVRQLRLIKADEAELLNAIDDYYRCSSERFRLAVEGDLTSDDWIDFDNRITAHWRIIAGREKRAVSGRDPIEIGYATYSTTIGHETKLGLDTPQPYLTRGSFHRLANEVTIGWHPDYEMLCKDSQDHERAI
jgi:hypothetical protein